MSTFSETMKNLGKSMVQIKNPIKPLQKASPQPFRNTVGSTPAINDRLHRHQCGDGHVWSGRLRATKLPALQLEMMPLQFQPHEASMTITKQVPAGLLQALGLHKGDLMTVRDESSDSFIVEITPAEDQFSTKAPMSHRQAALQRFSVGASVEHAASEKEIDEARYDYLRTKHLK